METVEGSLHQGRHDAAQAGLVVTAVPLAIVLHAKPRGQATVTVWVLTLCLQADGSQRADTTWTRNSDWAC